MGDYFEYGFVRWENNTMTPIIHYCFSGMGLHYFTTYDEKEYLFNAKTKKVYIKNGTNEDGEPKWVVPLLRLKHLSITYNIF